MDILEKSSKKSRDIRHSFFYYDNTSGMNENNEHQTTRSPTKVAKSSKKSRDFNTPLMPDDNECENETNNEPPSTRYPIKVAKSSKKSREKNYCDVCDHLSRDIHDYIKHVSTQKHIKMIKRKNNIPDIYVEPQYNCTICEYTTNRKSNYTKHLSSKKHGHMTKLYNNTVNEN